MHISTQELRDRFKGQAKRRAHAQTESNAILLLIEARAEDYRAAADAVQAEAGTLIDLLATLKELAERTERETR